MTPVIVEKDIMSFPARTTEGSAIPAWNLAIINNVPEYNMKVSETVHCITPPAVTDIVN